MEQLLKIAFFDSGIGGITVLKNAVELMPDEDYIYFADTQNVPYGTKPKEDVKRFVMQAADFLASKGIKALVVACNTATSVVIHDLREKFDFPIIGMEPAVKPAIVNNGGKKILVTATSLTLRESKLESLIETLEGNERIEKLPLDPLVKFAESFDFGSREVREFLIDAFSRFNPDEFESLVLGCTHFIFYKPVLKEILPASIKIIDGNEGTIRHLMATLNSRGLLRKGKGDIEFYSSCVEEGEERKALLKGLLKLEY